jgi:hypothetical protein
MVRRWWRLRVCGTRRDGLGVATEQFERCSRAYLTLVGGRSPSDDREPAEDSPSGAIALRRIESSNDLIEASTSSGPVEGFSKCVADHVGNVVRVVKLIGEAARHYNEDVSGVAPVELAPGITSE